MRMLYTRRQRSPMRVEQGFGLSMIPMFHASPPGGEWINDPNGLINVAGTWRLFVQHRVDKPHFRATGWARFSSRNLLHWTWDGAVLPPDAAWQYSGSVMKTPAGLRAWHSCHQNGQEWQVVRDGDADGGRWSAPRMLATLGQPASNRRDPFVWQADGQYRLLLAEPCDWHNAAGARSQLALHASHDGEDWRRTATIGPWHPAGIMWEVPVVVAVDGHDVLLVSTIDRTGGGADCAVHAWVGRCTDAGFQRHPACGAAGQRLDLGPDFYAAIPADGSALCIAWLSGWATARTMPWQGLAGGPLSLPRRLGVRWDEGRPFVTQAIAVEHQFDQPAAGPPGRATATAAADTDLIVAAAAGTLRLQVAISPTRGIVSVSRSGAAGLGWDRVHACRLAVAGQRRVAVYADGPALEIALPGDGLVISVAMAPAAGAIAVRAGGADLPLAWHAPLPPDNRAQPPRRFSTPPG